MCIIDSLYIFGLICLGPSALPAEVPLVLFGIALATVGTVFLPLGVLRWQTQQVISRELGGKKVEASQFGIRHLFIATAVTAVLITLAQVAFSGAEFDAEAPWFEIISFIAIYMLLSCLVCLLSLALVFGEKQRLLNIGMLLSVILIGSLVAIGLLATNFQDFSSDLGEQFATSVFYCVLLSSELVAVLALFKSFGYKLQRV